MVKVSEKPAKKATKKSTKKTVETEVVEEIQNIQENKEEPKEEPVEETITEEIEESETETEQVTPEDAIEQLKEAEKILNSEEINKNPEKGLETINSTLNNLENLEDKLKKDIMNEGSIVETFDNDAVKKLFNKKDSFNQFWNGSRPSWFY